MVNYLTIRLAILTLSGYAMGSFSTYFKSVCPSLKEAPRTWKIIYIVIQTLLSIAIAVPIFNIQLSYLVKGIVRF